MINLNRSAIEKIQYFFIDGAYFRLVLEDLSKKYFNGVDLYKVIDFNKVRSFNGFKKVFY